MGMVFDEFVEGWTVAPQVVAKYTRIPPLAPHVLDAIAAMVEDWVWDWEDDLPTPPQSLWY